MAYDWIVDGKIGCHFPERGEQAAVNFDVKRIVYSDDGNQNNIKEIERVYYIDATAAAAILAKPTTQEQLDELHKWSVWYRYWGEIVNRQLAMDTDGYVLIKYNPGLTDVSANNIGIFTTNSTSDNGRCVYILNEDGWLVGKSNATETKNIDIEKYGLTGTLRTTTFSTPFVFKAGKDYWIQYYFENCQNAADAYYDGIQGTDYKRLSLSNLYNTNPLDLSQYNYVGTVFDSTAHIADLVDSVLSLNYNDCFLSTKSIYHPLTGLTENYLYARTSSYSSYYGLLDHSSLPTDQNKPRNDELVNISAGQVFTIKTVTQNYNGVYIWQRGNQKIPEFDPGYNNVVITGNNAKNNYADFINNITPNKYCQFSAISDISYVNLNDGRAPKTDGTIYVRTEQGLTNCGSNNMQTTQIGNPIAGTVYYKADGLDLPGSTVWGADSIVIYLGNNTYADFDFNKTYTITADDNTTAACQHFSAISLNDVATDVTNTVWNNIYSQVATDSTKTNITSTSTSADIKHYLEINGNEVF